MLLKSYDLPYKDFKFEILYIESNNDKETFNYFSIGRRFKKENFTGMSAEVPLPRFTFCFVIILFLGGGWGEGANKL